MQQIDWLVLAGIILFLCLMVVLLVRFVKDLVTPSSERTGTRSSSGGGVIGALGVLDRIVNPAGAHVEEAKEVEQEEQGIGGE